MEEHIGITMVVLKNIEKDPVVMTGFFYASEHADDADYADYTDLH
jgi:hypothetical protein